jgi:hypothetical protein
MAAQTKPAKAEVTEQESKKNLDALQSAVGAMLRDAQLYRLETRPAERERLRGTIARRYEAARRLYDTCADLSDPKILPADDADATWFIQRAEAARNSIFGPADPQASIAENGAS